jgi:hypothetical protein
MVDFYVAELAVIKACRLSSATGHLVMSKQLCWDEAKLVFLLLLRQVGGVKQRDIADYLGVPRLNVYRGYKRAQALMDNPICESFRAKVARANVLFETLAEALSPLR